MSYNTLASIEPLDLTDALKETPEDQTEVYRGLTDLYFSLIPGALTLSLLVFLTIRPSSRTTQQELTESAGSAWPARLAVGLFLVIGWFGAAFLHPGKLSHGIAHSAGFPTVLVLLAVGWGLLSRAPRWITALVVAGMVIEFLLMFWSHWWFLTHDPAVLERLPGNAAYKPDPVPVVFLNERISDGQNIFPAGLIVIQLGLVCLLIGFLCGLWPRPREESS